MVQSIGETGRKKQGHVVTSGLCWYAGRNVRVDCLEHHDKT